LHIAATVWVEAPEALRSFVDGEPLRRAQLLDDSSQAIDAFDKRPRLPAATSERRLSSRLMAAAPCLGSFFERHARYSNAVPEVGSADCQRLFQAPSDWRQNGGRFGWAEAPQKRTEVSKRLGWG